MELIAGLSWACSVAPPCGAAAVGAVMIPYPRCQPREPMQLGKFNIMDYGESEF